MKTEKMESDEMKLKKMKTDKNFTDKQKIKIKIVLAILIPLFFVVYGHFSKNEQIKKPDLSKLKLVKWYSFNELIESRYFPYKVKNGTFKFISKKPNKIHIQISNWTTKKISKAMNTESVKRSIVTTAFKFFANTYVDEFTITSIPKEYAIKTRYFKEYRKTLKVSRKKAMQVLKLYFNTVDFSILYKYEDPNWVPTKKFELLTNKELNTVYHLLGGKS